MTAREEQLLTAYLLSTGEIEEAGHFTGWYAAVRNGSAGGEVEYKEVLALAGAWRRGFHQGYVAAQEPPEADAVAPPEASLSCPGVPAETGARAANQEPCHHHRNPAAT